LEPFAANLLTQQKNPRKRPFDRNNSAHDSEPQRNGAEQNLAKQSKINSLGSNLAKKSLKTYSDGSNSKIILQQSIASLYKIKKLLLDLENQNMNPDVKIIEIQKVIEDLSEIEGSLGEPIIKEVYMSPPELQQKAFVNSEIQQEPVNLMEKTNSTFVKLQPIELEVEGQSFMIQTSIEPDEFDCESEENVDIVRSELDPIEIKQRKISKVLRNQSEIKNSGSIFTKHNQQKVKSEILNFEPNDLEINYDDLSKNPWKVSNLQLFLRFHCPECGFLSMYENEFHSHAIKHHDQAKEIWGKDVESKNISETFEADIYQESKSQLEGTVIVKTDETDFESNTEMAEGKSFQVSQKLLDESFSCDGSNLESNTEMVDLHIYEESATVLEENGSAISCKNDFKQSDEIAEKNDYQDSKMLLVEKVRAESDIEPSFDLAKESKTYKNSAKINLEPNIEMVEAKKWLEKSFNTKNIDVPTSVQARDSTQNVDIDFDSLEVQNVLENTETLFGYDDFRDNFDRYSIDYSLDSSQWIKNDMPERIWKFRTIRELKLMSNLPLIKKVNHVSEDQSLDNLEECKKRKTKKLIVKICKKTKEFICPIKGCYNRYKTISSLQNHITDHSKTKVKVPREKQEMTTVQCKQCGWKSKLLATQFANLKLKKHLFYHHNSNHTSDSICDICGMKFFDLGDLEKHKKVFHGEDKVCEICGESFKSSLSLNKHRKNHIDSQLMKCEICDKQIKGASRLKVHKQRAHQNASLRACHICHKVLYNRCELYKHYMDDHSQNENPVQIDGKYVFQCEYCNKILGSLPAHYTHIKLTHKIKKTASEIKVMKKQNCPLCTEENLTSKDYVIHLVNEHPDKQPPNDLKNLEKGFHCSDCDEIYHTPMFYYRHLKYNHEKIIGGKYDHTLN
jgi:hypothetical protein